MFYVPLKKKKKKKKKKIYIYKLGKGAKYLTKILFGSTGSRKDAEMIGVKLYVAS